MGILKLLFYLIFPVIYAYNDCPVSLCGNFSFYIRFPFYLEGEQAPYCGYPSFNLFCKNHTKPILKLPFSEEFYVRNINYVTKQIQLYDPNDCLPKRLLSLNLSNSPFISIFRRDYTFLSCSSQNIGLGSQYIPIDCLSNSTYFVSAILSIYLVNNSLPKSCSVIKRVLVPVARQEQYEENFRDDLSADVQLTWDKPDCRFCESRQLMCGFESMHSNQVVCMSDYKAGTSRQGLKVFRIIALCITGPALIFVIIMASCVCYTDRRGNITRNAASGSAPGANAIAPQPELTLTTGLDESTIESYEKVIIGESRRVPGPNDECCWICLSEYNSKETVRCIPECKHCFHADCIDEWLRMNNTCPVCRNSPAPSPLNVVASSNV